MNRDLFKELMKDNIKSLTYEEHGDLMVESINYDGPTTKLVIAIEEMAELQKEITKILRKIEAEGWTLNVDKAGLLEEMADVFIGLGYVKGLFGLTDEEVDKAITIKMMGDKVRLRMLNEKVENITKGMHE